MATKAGIWCTGISADQLIDGLEKFADLLRQEHGWTQEQTDALLLPLTAAIESGDYSPKAEMAGKAVKGLIEAGEQDQWRRKIH